MSFIAILILGGAAFLLPRYSWTYVIKQASRAMEIKRDHYTRRPKKHARERALQHVLLKSAEMKQRYDKLMVGASPSYHSFIIVMFCVVVISFLLYLWSSWPLQRDHPWRAQATELQLARASLPEMVNFLEIFAYQNPKDALVHDLLGSFYLKLQKGAAALAAYEQAIELGGINQQRNAGLIKARQLLRSSAVKEQGSDG